MAELFKRAALLTVGTRRFTTRLVFSVEKNLEVSANKAKVTAYNLTKTSRALVSEPGQVMRIEAGYGDTLSTIFTGRIAENGVTIAKNGPDILTAIEAGDGEVELKTPVDLTMGYNATVLQALNTATGLTGVAAGVINGLKNRRFENGFAFSGSMQELLELIKKDSGADICIRDGELQVLPEDEGTNEEAVVLTQNTGLLGVPTKEKENFKAKSLLNPKIQPGRLVQVTSRVADIDGLFKVTKVVHNGDTKEGDWFSNLEGRQIG